MANPNPKYWIELLIYQHATGINPLTRKRQAMMPVQWFSLEKVGITKPIPESRIAQAVEIVEKREGIHHAVYIPEKTIADEEVPF